MHRKLMFQTQHLATPGVAVHRKLMFHAQFSGLTGELYAVGQIRLLNAVEIFLTASI